jgi:hypothetical protein
LMLDRERQQEARQQLHRLLDKLTPAHRRYVEALDRNDGDHGAALRELGLAPSTARVMRRDIRMRDN